MRDDIDTLIGRLVDDGATEITVRFHASKVDCAALIGSWRTATGGTMGEALNNLHEKLLTTPEEA